MCHLPGPAPAEGWPMFITQLQTWPAWALCGWQTTKISWLDFSSSVCQLGLAGIPWAQRLLASLGLFCNSQQSDKAFEGTTHTFSSGEAIYILCCHDLKKKKNVFQCCHITHRHCCCPVSFFNYYYFLFIMQNMQAKTSWQVFYFLSKH